MPSLNGFDANAYEPQSFDLIPDGTYEAVIVNSEYGETKSGNGNMKLTFELQIISDPCRGRKIWDLLNIVNANDKAEEIAKGTLSSICRAVGNLTPTDSVELHNIPMIISVGKENPQDGYSAKNKVFSYRPLLATPPAVAAQQAAVVPTPAEQAEGEKPNDGIPF